MEFGIISEGVTDQIVLENILIGFFEDKNLPVNPLQPKPNEAGNWDKVFRYCQSEDFRQAFDFLDFVIVQIDFDFMRGPDVPEKYRFDFSNCSPEEIAFLMKEKLTESIGQTFYETHSDQIIFAVAVDSIECWFLPIYFSNKPKTAAKTTNCLETLNQVLPNVEGFSIHAKEEKYYRKIAKHFQKRRDLLVFASKNPSFKVFINELEAKTQSQT